jgi:hypothetical protein
VNLCFNHHLNVDSDALKNYWHIRFQSGIEERRHRIMGDTQGKVESNARGTK